MVVNTTLSADANDITLNIVDQSISQAYFIQMAALNQVGQGPFSTPLEVDRFDPISILIPKGQNTQNQNLFIQNNKQVTLIIGVISAALFVLILISAVICYKKKLQSEQKPIGE